MASATLTIEASSSQPWYKTFYASATQKLKTLLGKDVCRLGSPYSIGVALMVIGFLTSIKVLPIGVYFGLQLSLVGSVIIVITAIKHQSRNHRRHRRKEELVTH